MNDSASGIRLPGRARSRWSRRSTPTPSMITTSASSPRARRVGIASGESPIEGPRVVTSLCPVEFSNAGPSSLYTLKNPAEFITFTSAAVAPDPKTMVIRKANRQAIRRLQRHWRLRAISDFEALYSRKHNEEVRLYAFDLFNDD